MFNCAKGFLFGVAVSALALMMLPGRTERKIRRCAPARAMRHYGERACGMIADMLP